MKLFDDVMGMVRRYGPTLIAHLLLFAVLSLFVLDIAKLPDGAVIWTELSGRTESTLQAIGLSLKLWYVLAAFLIAYLTAFEWVRRWVLAIPVLKMRYPRRADPALLAWACRVLRVEPHRWKVEDALNFEIERSVERVRQSNQRHPYQYLIDRQAFLLAYYGTLLMALLAVIAWGLSGGQYALTPGHVWWAAAALAAGAFVLRWVIQRQDTVLWRRTAAWALYQFERADTRPEDPLAYERGEAMARLATEDAAYRRHPASILFGLLRPLPKTMRGAIADRIAFPRRSDERDWRAIASRRMRLSDETGVVPAALQVQPFAGRFASLLEREGTGLCIVVPEFSGLALAAVRGGSTFSFATRRHDQEGFGIELWCGDSLDTPELRPQLYLQTGGAGGFIARIGTVPIARLILGDFPRSDGKDWGPLFRDALDARMLLGRYDDVATTDDGIELRRLVDLEVGSSYLVAVKMENGIRARVVLQCFREAASERLLIAWGFLEVLADVPDQVGIAPWWKPAAWKGLIKPPRSP